EASRRECTLPCMTDCESEAQRHPAERSSFYEILTRHHSVSSGLLCPEEALVRRRQQRPGGLTVLGVARDAGAHRELDRMPEARRLQDELAHGLSQLLRLVGGAAVAGVMQKQ